MIGDYRKASKKGKRQVSRAIAQGRYPYPLSLDEVLAGQSTAGELSLGVREIPLELVVGTKARGRSNMFSNDFFPIADEATEFAAKWSALLDSQRTEGLREPVLAYEYLQRFYVQEGNKRVSVMRYLGAPSIVADVTRVLPCDSDDEAIRRYRAFERLWRVAPVYGLDFSDAVSYERLARLLGQNLQTAWPESLVKNLDATIRQFSTSLKARGGDLLPLTVADAFLVYVRSYATDDPLFVLPDQMDRRVARIWGEITVQANEEPIVYIEGPTQDTGGIATALKSAGRRIRRKPLRLAFVYDRNPLTSGWVAQHERGREWLAQRRASDVEASAFFDCVSDSDFAKAVSDAVANKSDVIVTASPRQMDQTRRAAVAHPEVTFVNCSVNLSSGAVRSFYARMYEVKFLMGAMAASLSGNHRVGYIAPSPIYGSVAEINAFALGAELVDPYATVHLKWFATEGSDWRHEFEQDVVHVVVGRDYPNPQDPDEPWGLFCTRPDAPPERVVTPVWDWGRYYELIVNSLMDDSWRREGRVHRDRALNYWWGLSAGVVRLELAEGAPAGTRKLVGLLQNALQEGRLRPFEGTLAAQRGGSVGERDSSGLSSEQIASMRWLNGNVSGRLPKSWELTSEAADDVATSGIISAETDAKVG